MERFGSGAPQGRSGRPNKFVPGEGERPTRFPARIDGQHGIERSSGQGSFSGSVEDLTKRFYGDVLQNLRAWTAAPPKLKRAAERDEAAEVVADLIGVEPEVVAEDALPPEGVAQPVDEPLPDAERPT
jgi:hypothetical protein